MLKIDLEICLKMIKNLHYFESYKHFECNLQTDIQLKCSPSNVIPNPIMNDMADVYQIDLLTRIIL